jgi:hypothetical protein
MADKIKTKFIDSKGGLLLHQWRGKEWRINAIDFLVIVFALCLTPMFYFGWKFYHKKPTPESPTVTFDKAEYEQAQAKQTIKYERALLKHWQEIHRYQQEIAELENEIATEKKIKDKFLDEYKGARKHFLKGGEQ